MKAIRFLALPLLLLLAQTPARAQAVVQTVILPQSSAPDLTLAAKGQITLRFKTAPLPPQAATDKCYLQLIFNSTLRNRIFISVYNTKTGQRSDIRQLTSKNWVGEAISFRVDTNLLRTGGEFDVRLEGSWDSEPKSIAFLGSSLTTPGQTPRLVFSYRPNELTRAHWAGTRSNAQHTNLMPVPILGETVKEWTAVSTGWPVGRVQTQPVIYDDTVFIAGRLTDDGEKLYGCSGKGCRLVASDLKGADITVAPAVDRGGHLYYPTKEGIDVIDLRSGAHRIPAPLEITRANTERSLTLGPDGALYLARPESIEAFSPYPEHRRLWIYNLTGSAKSAVTLNASGSLAYVVTFEGDSGRIVALKTDRGTLEAQAGLKLSAGQSRAPLAAVTANGNVYVPNQVQSPQKTFAYDSLLRFIALYDSSGAQSPLAAAFGDEMPIYIAGNRIKRGRDLAYDVVLPFQAPATALMVDGAGGVYAYSGGRPYYYNPKDGRQSDWPSSGDPGNTGTPVLGADGTFYVVRDETVWRWVPGSFHTAASDGYRVSFSDVNYARSVVRAQNLIVSGSPDTPSEDQKLIINHETVLNGVRNAKLEKAVVKKGAKLTVRSGSGISFGPDFTVERGAILSCQSGQQ